jgi:thioredoxin reductase (NADPH)
MTKAIPENKSSLVSHTADVAIIGAGPVGLFAVFELGLLDLTCVVVDVLAVPGGQCAELYPDKPIYDIPALPSVTGAELTANLMAQIKPFAPQFVLGEQVITMARSGEAWVMTTDAGITITARAIVFATGGGLFTPKKLPLPNAADFEDRSLFYAVKKRADLAGKHIVIAGGGDSALDWTLEALDIAAHVTLTHRRDEFRGSPAQVNKMRAAVDAGRMDLVIGGIAGLRGQNGQIERVMIAGADGQMVEMPCDRMLVFYGLTMTDVSIDGAPLRDDSGLWPVDTAAFQTTVPGVYAIGDGCTYPGKLKLILSGFHEGALAAQSIFKYIHPDKKYRFLYTTASSSLHKKLGV